MTPRQSAALIYIANYLRAKAAAPSYAEVAAAIGLKSKASVLRLAQGLVDRGYLHREAGHHRTLALTPAGVAYITNPAGGYNLSATFTDDEKATAAAREVGMRRSVYAKRVFAGEMSQEEADRGIALMDEIAREYRAKCPPSPQGSFL